MSDPWGDSDSGDESTSEDEEVELTSGFTEQLESAIEKDMLDKLTISTIRNGVEKISEEDADLLKTAYEDEERDEAQKVLRARLHDLGKSPPHGETEQETLVEDSDDEEVQDEKTNDSQSDEDDSMASEVDIGDIAPNAMTPEQAAEKEHLWRVLIWGSPGVGKTHFGYTMPEPICIIDTEGKGHDIAHKFDDSDFYVWQPNGYDGARDSLHEAMDVLDAYFEQDGTRGTLVVDSMSVMWGWAQQKYVDKYYPGKDVDDVNFTAGFSGGESDWKKIKDLHNAQFRAVMVNSNYHLCWTAMREQDYSAAMEGDQDRMKPVGEKENVYKVDTILHVDESSRGVPQGELEKSGLIQNRFKNLEYPTFPKVKEIINDVDAAEGEPDPVDADEVTDYDVSIVKGNPRFINDGED